MLLAGKISKNEAKLCRRSQRFLHILCYASPPGGRFIVRQSLGVLCGKIKKLSCESLKILEN
ncbi:MAG: hypothetical protein A3D57_05520 [Candidatus Sungbacteria bacterium RIFCSPHIGHO2_02_FULL_46_12]|nr:MAG: hypothetical protein A3D57_05520 [Candidatus Sungbacteria bacterium RIFCSPHIGHO2_02_FULL_46_12]